MKASCSAFPAFALFAGITLSAVGATTPSTLTLDVTQPGAEISPYLYGQFIEHLGRCIHDGIWAEKLRDRKFLLPLDKSPWHTNQSTETRFEAFLDPAGAFAGDHCLGLWRRDTNGTPCGISQNNIGLVAGKDYVGYALLATVSGDPAVQVTLAWGNLPNDQQTVRLHGLNSSYRRVPFEFHASKTTDSASLAIQLTRPGLVWVGCISLMPADNVKGIRSDVLGLIKRLNPPITRWPGGNFVSGYNWKDGIGERDRRPPRWERAWNDVEDNDFGLDEFMTFCAEVGTEPYIAVNTGLGTLQDAADEVEYATGSKRSHWGGERARNGHSNPYKVVWWGIGNEMYGAWQLGNIPTERYALRHNAFVQAMKAKNSGIKIIGVGTPDRWNDVFLPISAPHMDLLSGHHYTLRNLVVPFSSEDAAKYDENFFAYSASVAEGVKRIVNDFRQRIGPANPALNRVRLAVDEWGLVREWKPEPDPPGVGSFEVFYPLGDCLAAARGLNELLRSADVVRMANWAQLVNVIGAIKASRNYAVLDSIGHLLALYRAEVRGSVVPLRLDADTPVDAVAALDRKTGGLSIALVNFSPTNDVALNVSCLPGSISKAAQGWRINGPSLTVINVPGEPENIRTEPLPQVAFDSPVLLPAHSITVLKAKWRKAKYTQRHK